MIIWVDADACPNTIKSILFRAAKRTEIMTILVANAILATPPSKFISSIRVERGFDSADDYIVEHMNAQDIVITADIPLAAQVVAKQGTAINPRGEVYTQNNVTQRLGLRDIREGLRGSGVNVGGPPGLSTKEITAFANALDKMLAKK